jgi:hypothetical protein
MPPKKIEDPAAQFANWLTWEHDSALSRGTARVYGSIVRSAVTAMADPGDTATNRWRHIVNQEKVSDFFRALWEENPARFDRTKRPWELFCEWGAELKIDVVAVPDAETGAKSLAHLPAEVMMAVHYIVSRRLFSLRVLPHLVWADVEEKKDGPYQVRDPRRPSTFMLVSVAVIEKLRTFAAPEDGLAPLIPATPSGREPLSTRQLGNELKRFRRAHGIEELDPLKDQIEEARKARGDGSAAGGSAPEVQTVAASGSALRPSSAVEEYQGYEIEHGGGLDLRSLMAYNPDAVD